MKKRIVALALFLSLFLLPFLQGPAWKLNDPCDSYGDCISASITYVRANPDDSLYVGDQFTVRLQITPGSGGSSCGQGCSESWSGSVSGVTWSYDQGVFSANTTSTSGQFIVSGNRTGMYAVTETALFVVTVSVTVCSTAGNPPVTTCSTSTYTAQSSVPVSEQVTIIRLVLHETLSVANVTDRTTGFVSRNPDGSFYHNDSFCAGWTAAFQFSDSRPDITINATGSLPAYLKQISSNYTGSAPGRSGYICYKVKPDAPYHNATLAVNFNAFNWLGVSIAHISRSIPFAVVRYNPTFTSYSYMLYRNSTASSSLGRPWILFVRYDGNDPGYSYAGDNNTRPFASGTLAERAYFDKVCFSTLSYQPFTTVGGVFDFHMINSTGTIQYNWLNARNSAPLYYGNRIEKYVFNVTASSLPSLLARGFVYHNVTMVGCWGHEGMCDLKQNYWLVPFLWSGRLNIVSVDSNGSPVPNMPISITIRNPSPLNQWLEANFTRVFGNDSQAIRAFQADLYPTYRTMTFSGSGRLSIWFNQTSLSPPTVSITAGGISLGGSFTFVPTFVNSAIASVPNSLNGTVFYANATIPLWSYNMVRGSLSFLPISTTIDHPSTFLELVNSSGWIAGTTTAPQTPSAFASQSYGFWPFGENLTIYANLQGGGIKLLGTQKLGPNDYQASFYMEPWSGGISSAQLVEGNSVLAPQSILGGNVYPSQLPQGLTGIYSVSYTGTGEDTKLVFTNLWGATTSVDLGASPVLNPPINLIPATTATAFGMAAIAWLIVSGALKTRKTETHQ